MRFLLKTIIDIPKNVSVIVTPIIRANKVGSMNSINIVTKIEIADSWFPIYTDNIAATGTDDNNIPKNIPIEHAIDIPAKLIERESMVLWIMYSGKLPKL